MYNIGIYIYQLGISLASVFSEKARKLRKGQSEALGVLKNKAINGESYVWFHAASLGEFEQGRPVIEKLKHINSETKILLTFFSSSGYEIRKNYQYADIVCYLPPDKPTNVRKFLKTVKISKAIFIKYEFWANYLKVLRKNNIPVYSISAIFRPQQLFFKPYGFWYLKILKNFTHIFVQDEDSAMLLEKYDIKNVTVAGDTRFDSVTRLTQKANNIPVVEAFINNSTQLIVAGSTWLEDEKLLIKYLNENPSVKLILAPHDISESHIESIIKLLKNNFVRFTQAKTSETVKFNCLIVDTIGLLSSIYQYANIAYIGGGFGNGIHNTLEAAVWNVPVVFGPNYKKFREARELINIGGGFSVSNYDELKSNLDILFKDNIAGKTAGNYVAKHAGATDLILKIL